MQHQHFKELRDWSERKHELIVNYLAGFVKILGGATKDLVYYVDGFAGPGIYDDGAKGSPIRAAEYAQTLINRYYQLHCINVEANRERFDNLERNTEPYRPFTTNYFGAFADHVDEILKQVGDRPTIFFLDPFGLKGIEWECIYPILGRTYITEILLRVNPQDISRLAGFADSGDRGAVKKCQVLTNLYGFPDSEQWEQVWHAEGTDGLVKLYTKRLSSIVRREHGRSYVCMYAIKTIEGRLKYYLIFVTRHPKGAILMSNIIYARERCYERDVKEYKEECLALQPARQLTMFEALAPPPTEDEIFASLASRLKEDVRQVFEGKTASRTDIHEAMLPTWFGRVSDRHFTQVLKELEEDGKILYRSGTRSKPQTKFTFQG
jgi:three-Cys-motif partner protein